MNFFIVLPFFLKYLANAEYMINYLLAIITFYLYQLLDAGSILRS